MPIFGLETAARSKIMLMPVPRRIPQSSFQKRQATKVTSQTANSTLLVLQMFFVLCTSMPKIMETVMTEARAVRGMKAKAGSRNA